MPAIIIGLGGTGREIIKYLKKESQLVFVGNNPSDQKYLLIDMESKSVDQEADSIIGQHEFIHLTKTNPNSKAFLGGIINKKAFKKIWPENIFNESNIPFLSSMGAGQVRLMGRLALYYDFYNARGIYTKIDNHIKNITTGNPDQNISFVICGSIAGGTGSGLWLDLAYYIHYILKETSKDKFKHTIDGYFLLSDAALEKRVVDPEAHTIAQAMTYSCIWEMNTVMSDKFISPTKGFELPFDNPTNMNNFQNNPFDMIGLIDLENQNNATLMPTSWKSYVKMTAQFIFDQYLRMGIGARAGRQINKGVSLIDTQHGFSKRFERISRTILRYPKNDWLDFIISMLLDNVIQDYCKREKSNQSPKGAFEFFMNDLLEMNVSVNINKTVFDYRKFLEKYFEDISLQNELENQFGVRTLYYNSSTNTLRSQINNKKTNFKEFEITYNTHLNNYNNSIKQILNMGENTIKEFVLRKYKENLIKYIEDNTLSNIHSYLHWLMDTGKGFKTMKDALLIEKQNIATEISQKNDYISKKILSNKKKIKKELLNEDKKITKLYWDENIIDFIVYKMLPALEERTKKVLEAINTSVEIYTGILTKMRKMRTAIDTGTYYSENYDQEGMILEVFGLRDIKERKINIINKNWVEKNIVAEMRNNINNIWKKVNENNISLIQDIVIKTINGQAYYNREVLIDNLYKNIKDNMVKIMNDDNLKLPSNLLEAIIFQVAIENGVKGNSLQDVYKNVIQQHKTKINGYIQDIRNAIEGISSPFLKMSPYLENDDDYKVNDFTQMINVSKDLSNLEVGGYTLQNITNVFGQINITDNMANPLNEILISFSKYGQIVTMEKINHNITLPLEQNEAKYYTSFKKIESQPQMSSYKRIHLDKRLMPSGGLYPMVPSGESSLWIFYVAQGLGIIKPQYNKKGGETGFYIYNNDNIKDNTKAIKGRKNILNHFEQNQPLQMQVLNDINKKWQSIPATLRVQTIRDVIKYYEEMSSYTNKKISKDLKESYKKAKELLERMLNNGDFNKGTL